MSRHIDLGGLDILSPPFHWLVSTRQYSRQQLASAWFCFSSDTSFGFAVTSFVFYNIFPCDTLTTSQQQGSERDLHVACVQSMQTIHQKIPESLQWGSRPLSAPCQTCILFLWRAHFHLALQSCHLSDHHRDANGTSHQGCSRNYPLFCWGGVCPKWHVK